MTALGMILNQLSETENGDTVVILGGDSEEMEKILIEKALRKYDNNISAVAAELGISRPTLYSKIRKYEL